MNQRHLNPQVIPLAYWYAKQCAKWLGVAGLFGVGLMLASALFYLFEFIPEKQQLFEAQQKLVELEERANSVSVKEPVESNSENELVSFYSTFPDAAVLSSSLKLIQQTAVKNKLLLNRGDYKFTLNSNSVKQYSQKNLLARYEIQFPVTGEYVHIRNFIDEVMMLLPTLALSEMQVRRENSLAPSVDGRLRLVLFVKDGTWR